MVRSLLYDKEISVTLYRPPEVKKAYYVSNVSQGFQQTIISGKRKLYSQQVEAGSNEAIGESAPRPATLEFYEDDSLVGAGGIVRVLVDYKQNEDGTVSAICKNIERSGKAWQVDTIEQMKTGFSTSGVLFKSGDVVRVKEDGSKWLVFTDESTLEIEESTTEIPAETLVIKCTDEGLKPDIALSINLLPGQNCYGAILKIRNLNLDSVDIRKWSRMLITAGYRTGKKATYICPIFSSYIESPNPDGITTFEGVTVGTAEDVLNDQYIEIKFVQEKMDLDTLIRQVAPAISSNIEVKIAISDDIVKANADGSNLITITKQTVYAKNGMAVLSWLQSTVSAFVTELTRQEDGSYTSVFTQLVDNTLEVIALNGPNKMPEKAATIVNLDMVTGATFNGTALTVEAPWNPDLQPGGLFYMPPEFIYGSKLPNVLATEDYRNEDNLYRALTMSVAFASVEGTNKMTVLAIPAQWAGELPKNKTTEIRGDLFARALSSNMGVVEKTVEVGTADIELRDQVKVDGNTYATDKKMFDTYGKNLISTLGGAGAWTAVDIDITKGNCLSMIIEYYLFTDPSGPKLIPGTMGTNDEAAYFVKKDDLTNPKAKSHFQSTGCKASIVWWPLVTVGTYWKAIIDEASGFRDHNWNKVSITNPDLIQENKTLYIPIFSKWSSMLSKLKAVKDIWKFAYLEYKALYPNLCLVWRAMYYYLGGTDELN